MTPQASELRKIREQLNTRRGVLLARYRDTQDRADEELASPAHEAVDVASEQWDARVLSEMTDVDARARGRGRGDPPARRRDLRVLCGVRTADRARAAARAARGRRVRRLRTVRREHPAELGVLRWRGPLSHGRL